MRGIVQISDLHFGAHEPAVVEALRSALLALRPDLVVVSGDLTQRARTIQFGAADAFLRSLEEAGLALLVVPGNHDVPWHKPASRLFRPLARYRRMIGRTRATWYCDEEMAVLGLASAHGLTVKHGRLTRAQARRIERCFALAPPRATRLLVTHHPLVPLPGEEAGELEPALRGAARALAAVARAGVHLVLAGHHHVQSVGLAGPMLSVDPQVMVVQAGTATSWRRRGPPNSFNLLRLADDRHVAIEEWVFADGAFSSRRRSSAYARHDDGWAAA